MLFIFLNDIKFPTGPGLALNGKKNSRGEICFVDGDTPGSSFRGVTVRDLNSVSLLQVRLNELETGLKIMERSEVIEITT